jgi:hypothetical protein
MIKEDNCPYRRRRIFATVGQRHVGEDEIIMAMLSAPEALLASSSLIDGLVGGGLLADSSAMECGAGAV